MDGPECTEGGDDDIFPYHRVVVRFGGFMIRYLCWRNSPFLDKSCSPYNVGGQACTGVSKSGKEVRDKDQGDTDGKDG